MGRIWPAALAASVVLSLPLATKAQDSHVWSHHYGARSTLLGGAVIAGVDDASATYYNPGALATISERDIFEGTRIFDFTTLSIHAELDETVRLGSDDFGRAPSFLGGIIPTGWKRHTLSYAMFKRQAFDMRANVAVSEEQDVVRRSPGTEPVFVNIRLDNKLSEQWVGVGWAYAVNPMIGVGFTTFVARRSQRGLLDASGSAALNSGGVASSTLTEFYKYTHYRVVWKAGITASSERSTVGLTFTSPSFSLKGSGEREVIDSYAGLDLDQNGVPEHFLSADFQENVSTNYKAPVSVGLGYSLTLDRSRVHLSAEWYRAIPQYSVIRVEQAEGQTTGEPVDNGLSDAVDGVINGAIGVEQEFGKAFKGFASFSTDFSGAVGLEESNLSFTRWDLYHLTTGTRVNVGKIDLTLGVGYVFGSEESVRPNSLIGIDESNRLFGRDALTELQYRRIQFIVGLSVGT